MIRDFNITNLIYNIVVTDLNKETAYEFIKK